MKEKDGMITYDQADLAKMSPEEVNNVFMKQVKIEGVGVVRSASGHVKYDNPALAGSYGEEK